MNYTTNYDLPQWEAGDRVKRGDMNGAMAAIDAALGTLGAYRIETFTYTGNGGSGTAGRTYITFPHMPLFYIVIDNAVTIFGSTVGAVAISSDNVAYALGFVLNGNTVGLAAISAERQANVKNKTYTVVVLYQAD